MTFFFEVLIGGLLAGVMYSLVALGFVLIYKASGVFNFAQGAMVFFAALTYVGFLELGLPSWLSLPATLGVMIVMFVHPSQIAAIVKRHPEIARARLVVDNPEGADRMTLHVEVASNASSSNAPAIVASIRDITKLRGEVSFHAPGELANDGKVIDDMRKFD